MAGDPLLEAFNQDFSGSTKSRAPAKPTSPPVARQGTAARGASSTRNPVPPVTGAGGGGANPQQKKPPVKPRERSWWDATKDAVKGVTTGVVRAAPQALGGLLDFAGDVGAVGGKAAAGQLAKLGKDSSINQTIISANNAWKKSAIGQAFNAYADPNLDGRTDFGDQLSGKNTVGTWGSDAWNQGSTEVLSFLTAFGVASKASKATRLGSATSRGIAAIESVGVRKAAQIGAVAVGGSAVGAVVIDPDNERLANGLQALGVDNDFNDWLAADKDDGVFESRFKNAVEGVVTGVAADALFLAAKHTVKAARGNAKEAGEVGEELNKLLSAHSEAAGAPLPKRASMEQSSPELALADRLDDAFDNHRTIRRAADDQAFKDAEEQALANGEEPPVRPVAEEPVGTLPPERAEGTPEQLTKDVNEALTRSGVPDQLTPETIRVGPDGRVIVSQNAKEALDREGFGGAFASQTEQVSPDTVILRVSQDGGTMRGRIVGATTREDIDKLATSVKEWEDAIDRELDITAASAFKPTRELASKVGEFRIGPLGSQDRVGAILRGFTEALPPATRQSDDMVMKAAKAAADEIGEDPTVMLAVAEKIAGQTGDAAASMALARTMWVRMTRSIDDISLTETDWLDAGDDAVREAASAIHNMSLLSSFIQETKAGLGRGLRINRLTDADSYLSKVSDDVTEAIDDIRTPSPLPQTRQEIADWIDLWKMTKGDAKQRADFLASRLTVPTAGKYLRSSFANMFTANILSAPKTIALNVVGPSMVSTMRLVSRQLGATKMMANPFASPAERAAARIVAQQNAVAWVQTLGDIGDVFHYAQKAFKDNRTVLGGGGMAKDTLGHMGPLTENLLLAAGAQPGLRYSLGNLINVWPRAFARVNNGLDEFSKRMAYQGTLRVNARVEGIGQGLAGAELDDFVRDSIRNSYDEAGAASNANALRTAEQTTFTGQVGQEGSHIRGFANWINNLRADVPETRYVLPIFNVPANALGATIRSLPIVSNPKLFPGMFERTAKELSGEFGAVAQAEAHGRTMLGGAFLMSAIMMNRGGLMTGAGPKDATDRKIWLENHQPYSIRVGDQWVSYQKFDIIGGILSIPATIADESTYRPADEAMGDVVLSGIAAMATWFKDRAAFRTAAGFLNMGDNPTQDIGTFFESFKGTVASGLLVPAGVRVVGVDAQDPYQRMRRDWDDYIYGAVPGLSQQLEPVRNILGEPMQRSNDTYAEAFLPITMVPTSAHGDNSVMDETFRLYEATGYGAGADPKALGYGHFNPKDIVLEDGVTLFTHAMKLRQTAKMGGKTIKQTLDKLYKSKAYRDGVDGNAQSKKTSRGDLSRAYMVRKVFENFNGAIKAELAKDSDIAEAYLSAAEIKQKDNTYIRDLSVDELVQNPKLFSDRGINRGEFASKIKKGGKAKKLLDRLQN